MFMRRKMNELLEIIISIINIYDRNRQNAQSGRCKPPTRVGASEKSNRGTALLYVLKCPDWHFVRRTRQCILISTSRGMPAASAHHYRDAIWPKSKVSVPPASLAGVQPASRRLRC